MYKNIESCPVCGEPLAIDSKDSNNTNCIDIDCQYNQMEDMEDILFDYNCEVSSSNELFKDDELDDEFNEFEDDYDWGSLFD